jgi:hypothetical protein
VRFKKLWAFEMVISILLLNISVAFAEHADLDTQATSFITHIVAADFDGDSSARLGKILWSKDNRSPTGTECDCAESPDIYFVTGDALVVAKNWKMIGLKSVDNTRAEATFSFEVIGSAEEVNIGDRRNPNPRRIIHYPEPVSVEHIFQLQKIGPHWRLIGPAVPYVGLDAIIGRLRKEISGLDYAIKADKNDGHLAAAGLLGIHRSWLNNQLSKFKMFVAPGKIE